MSYGKSPWTGSEISLHGDFCSSILLGIKTPLFSCVFHDYTKNDYRSSFMKNSLSLFKWILADEPTKGLDPLLRRQMIDLLRKLHRDTGGGLIFITHDMRLVRELATICVVLREGRLVEAGRVVDVWERPRTVYARRLVQASKFPDGEAEEAYD